MVFPIEISTIEIKLRFKIHNFLSPYCKVCFIKMNAFVNLCSSQNVNQGYLLQLWPIVENILWQRVIHFCLENLVDREAWQAIIHGVTQSDTTERLSPQHVQNPLQPLKERHLMPFPLRHKLNHRYTYTLCSTVIY